MPDKTSSGKSTVLELLEMAVAAESVIPGDPQEAAEFQARNAAFDAEMRKQLEMFRFHQAGLCGEAASVAFWSGFSECRMCKQAGERERAETDYDRTLPRT